MTVFSHSRIETFEQCPLKYRFKYIDRIKTEVERSIEAFMGDMVHRTLEKLYKDLRFMYIDTLEELISYYEKLWEKEFTENLVIVRKEYSAENYREMGRQYITDYYRKHYPFDQMKTVALEMKVLIDLTDDGKYKLQGYIDRLATDGNGIFEIHDYKTGSNLPDAEKIGEDRQLALYSMAVRKMYPYAKRIFLIWHYLKFNQEIRIEKTDEELEETKRKIIEKIDEILSAKEFPAKESMLCDWCEFAPVCPKRKHLFETEKMEPQRFSEDEGVKLVTRYAELAARKKEIEEEMKSIEEGIFSFSEQKNIDNIAGKGVIAKVWKGENIKVPPADDPKRESVEKIIRDAGLWNDFSRLDSFSLSKAIQAGQIDAEIIKKLAPFLKKEKVRRIYLRERSG